MTNKMSHRSALNKPSLLFSMAALVLLGAANSYAFVDYNDAKEVFGLVGDGVADDTEGLQKAFKSKEKVCLPKGFYRFTKTLVAGNGTWIHGEGNQARPNLATTLVYDGAEGEPAILAEELHNFQLCSLNVDGNEKAAIGVLWRLAIFQSSMSDVSIFRTTDHALYVTRTWYASFYRLMLKNNLGNGLTLDRSHYKWGIGPINNVNFYNCQINQNGRAEDLEYDGDSVVDKGCGLASYGNNYANNFIGCTFELNGGPGIYLEAAPYNWRIVGTYMETNSCALRRKYEKLYGKDWYKDPETPGIEPIGRLADIIMDTNAGQASVVIDNCYIAEKGGIWLRGTGGGATPIYFKNVSNPAVIWSEHGNWVYIDSLFRNNAFTAVPGIIHKGKWSDPENNPPSGHPGLSITNGVRSVIPADVKGIDLYVNSESGDDANDGRTPTQAWRSLSKIAKLFNNTVVETPYTIHVAGENLSDLKLSGITGDGSLTFKAIDEAAIQNAKVSVSNCDIHFVGADLLKIGVVTLKRAPGVKLDNVKYDECVTE